MDVLCLRPDILCRARSVDRDIWWYRSVWRYRIGKAHAMHVIPTVDPPAVPATDVADACLVWRGPG